MIHHPALSRFLIAGLCALCHAAAAPPAKLAAQPRFEVQGDWRGGSTPGHLPGRGTLYSASKTATATWFPSIHSVCPVRVSFWVSPHAGNTGEAVLEIGRPGVTNPKNLDLRADPPRWESLGLFEFDGSGTEFIRLSKSKPGNLRAAAVKLEILDPLDHSMVWQTLLLDNLAAYDRAILGYEAHAFEDIPQDDLLSPIAARLAAEGILLPAASERPGTFAPDASMPSADFLAAFFRAVGGNASDPVALARSRAWLTGEIPKVFTARDAMILLARYARMSGRALDWVARPADPEDDLAWADALGLIRARSGPSLESATGALTRRQAAFLLARLRAAIIHSGPPGNGWTLAFHDDFNAAAINPSVWSVSNNQTWGKLLSIRMAGNVVQENGLLRLITRKEMVRDKEWTTGMIGTGKNFRQAYGYWEARMRYAPAPGLNNAFWTNPGKDPGGAPGWEIDVNEGHWPNTINASLHQDGLPSQSKAWRAPVDLSKDFHTYACLWTENEITYFWDGIEIDRKTNTHARRPGPVLFSTAVFPWAGSIGDALHLASMDVDWVRVWRREEDRPPTH
jgi:hypothetical protein